MRAAASLQHRAAALLSGRPRLRCACRRRAAASAAASASAAAAADGYETLAAPFVAELEVKKSRFVCHVAPARSPEAALAFIAAHRDAAARHNCWAYACGLHFRASDDGEPGGTAGRPILAAIEGAALDHVVVLVVRFFGGVKLGAGGLTRGARAQRAACGVRRVTCCAR